MSARKPDKTEKLMHSVIQHGKNSDRIYLMKLAGRDVPGIISGLDELAGRKKYGKIFAKVPADLAGKFTKAGYIMEAAIPGYFSGVKGCLFLAKYLSGERSRISDNKEVTRIINLSIRKVKNKGAVSAPYGYEIEKAGPDDVTEMSKVFKAVFKTYPFPITDPEYLLKTMKSHINYYTVRKDKKMVAVSSAEIDRDTATAEMTDFATLPEYRGKDLAVSLLAFMEEETRGEGIKTAYTIARALSYGMNIVFAKNNYNFAGTLTNNTNISGDIESMNVWYKTLSR